VLVGLGSEKLLLAGRYDKSENRGQRVAFVPAGAIVRKQKQLVAAFREARATSSGRATTLSELGIDAGMAARRLRRHDVLREDPAGALYLDEAAWEALCARRKRVASVAVGTALIIVALVLYARRF
jgi:hypothetical protein